MNLGSKSHTEIIVIPSRGRADALMSRARHTLTYARFADRPVFLVVRAKELESYRPVSDHFGPHIVTVPDHINTIAKTYDYVTGLCGKGIRALFMDDDLIFAERKDYSSAKLTKLDDRDFPLIENSLFDQLSNDPSVTISGLIHRRGAQTATKKLLFNRKLIAALCCDIDTIKEHNWKWDWSYNSMFDHHMILTQLESGLKNVQLTNITHDDVFTRFANGGCSDYRDNPEHSRAAVALADKFPWVVSLREKKAPDGSYGLDVTLHMKKAYGE